MYTLSILRLPVIYRPLVHLLIFPICYHDYSAFSPVATYLHCFAELTLMMVETRGWTYFWRQTCVKNIDAWLGGFEMPYTRNEYNQNPIADPITNRVTIGVGHGNGELQVRIV